MRKRYPLNQSPLYKLHSRKRLAKLLGLSPQRLNSILALGDSSYIQFRKTTEKEGKKKVRQIEYPRPELRQVQRRIVSLLDRIEPPEYIHSGFRGRSYVSNASAHKLNCRLAKIDIRNFFPSAYPGYTFRVFRDAFQCSPDVAAIIMKITMAFGHIPTGGSSSTIISFFAFKPMFDEIHVLARSLDLTMTCCVDDMTFTGAAATDAFLNEVRLIVQRYGLRTHKRHCFESQETKIVTGVALTPNGMKLPNSRRKRLSETLDRFNRETCPLDKVKLGEDLLGRATEAAQIEERFRPYVSSAKQRLNEAKRERSLRMVKTHSWPDKGRPSLVSRA